MSRAEGCWLSHQTPVTRVVALNTEPMVHCMGFGHQFIELGLSKSMRLDDAIRKISNIPSGTTDCSLPILYAMEHKLEVDCFVILTDSETYAGHIHPKQALEKYRGLTGINAKEVVVGMVANAFSIADPNDGRQLDVVGFDTATPAIISDFARN